MVELRPRTKASASAPAPTTAPATYSAPAKKVAKKNVGRPRKEVSAPARAKAKASTAEKTVKKAPARSKKATKASKSNAAPAAAPKPRGIKKVASTVAEDPEEDVGEEEDEAVEEVPKPKGRKGKATKAAGKAIAEDDGGEEDGEAPAGLEGERSSKRKRQADTEEAEDVENEADDDVVEQPRKRSKGKGTTVGQARSAPNKDLGNGVASSSVPGASKLVKKANGKATAAKKDKGEESDGPKPRIPDDERILTQKELTAKGNALQEFATKDALRWSEDETEYEVTKHVYLGGGNFGKVHLWLATDEHNNIRRRIAVKDCYVRTSEWNSVTHWYGDPRDTGKRVHAEIEIHRRIEEELESLPPYERYCTHVIKSVVDDARMFYRLYLEFCPHKDLGEVLKRYKTPKKSGRMKKKKAGQQDGPDQEPFVPEPFLWFVFEALAGACSCLLLDHERDSGSEQRGVDGNVNEQIVHRDIKPENVYLTSPNNQGEGPYPDYPRPILGDFGLGILTSHNDPLNPLTYNGREGTPGYMPPEMFPMHDSDTWQVDPVGELNSATNVWGIGSVITALINKEDISARLDYKQREEQPPLIQAHKDRYSAELTGLVEECTKYWPDQRITLQDLQGRIRASTGHEAADDKSGGRRQTSADVELRPDATLLWSGGDQYKVGSATP